MIKWRNAVTSVPIRLTVCKKLDDLACCHHQFADVINETPLFLYGQLVIGSKDKDIPIRIRSRCPPCTGSIKPNLCFWIHFQNISFDFFFHCLCIHCSIFLIDVAKIQFSFLNS